MSDTFDLLGTEIASLLRNTNELTQRTRRDAARDAEARLAAADEQARARLAEVDREVQARMGELEQIVTSIARREDAAAAVFDLAAELVERLEQRASRIAAESQGATDEIAPLRAALQRGSGDDGGEVIDLRDDAGSVDEPDTDRPRKGKAKHKRRRQRERA